MLGLSRYKIERTLEEKRENEDLIIRRNYMSEKESKILLKKYNYTISIVSDHLLLGYADTVDPISHKPLFNCMCTSAESDGYSISNKSIGLINQDSTVIHNLTEFCLMRMEYNLTRLKQFKKEILSKIKNEELSSLSQNNNNAKENNINFSKEKSLNENIKNNSENSFKKNNFVLDRISYINRNEINLMKNMDNNKKKLFTNIINHDKIENAINLLSKSKNEELKITLTEKGLKRPFNNSISRNNKILNLIQSNSEFHSNEKSKTIKSISKLRENIFNKQKRIELKNEDNKAELINKKNYNTLNNKDIKHSMSSESINNNKNKNNCENNKNKRNYKSLKKIRFNSMNIFKNYIKDFDTINFINNKMLSPLLTKSSVHILPSIKKEQKNALNFSNDNSNKNENNKIKKYEKNITDDLFKIDQLSFVKEKFIIFKNNKRAKKDSFNTINYDYLPRLNRNNQEQPMKIKKQFFKGISIELNENNKNNNKNEIKDSDDKKNTNYMSTLGSSSLNKQTSKEKEINDKYNELNSLVNNMHNITKEILSKKIN